MPVVTHTSCCMSMQPKPAVPPGHHLQLPLGCRSMRAFAEEYKKRGWPLNVLLNNAAIQSPKGKRGTKTEDGFEVRPCHAPPATR